MMSVLRAANDFEFSNFESPQFTGLVIAALAEEYVSRDIHGKQPGAMMVEEAGNIATVTEES